MKIDNPDNPAEIIAALLCFRWIHRGMGTYNCASCGAQAEAEDTGTGEIRLWRGETHSKTCPWRIADEYLERHR
jgi:hypothetical protein